MAKASVIHRQLPRCATCSSTDLVVTHSIDERQACGVDVDGQRYTAIRRQRMRCRRCGSSHVVVTRTYNPEDWKIRARI